MAPLFLPAFAQTTEKRAAFEVATIKLAPPEPADPYQAGYRKGTSMRGMVVAGKRVTLVDQTLKDLVRIAFGVKDHQVVAAPWMASQLFDVVASLPEGADRSQGPEMLRTLLEDRFQMECHQEPREMAVLALVVARGGYKPAVVEGNS
ncbi:MAG TPA: TIGR03435 family protein [Bryobacteraceae bacterium]|nr:TIGR03435 family protein [Bryobacteraceae bacterium]